MLVQNIAKSPTMVHTAAFELQLEAQELRYKVEDAFLRGDDASVVNLHQNYKVTIASMSHMRTKMSSTVELLDGNEKFISLEYLKEIDSWLYKMKLGEHKFAAFGKYLMSSSPENISSRMERFKCSDAT
eukprot:NODE_432_length_7521_cov_0.745891.p9 type:complete len:129 gc:universal NODE_432_length_7521_cov_0.745891:6662-6276(-)